MFTIFSLPKAFKGIFKTVQENAVLSWNNLKPSPDIILFGSDEGTKEFAESHGFGHLPNIKLMEIGTPIISDLFYQAAENTSNPYMCFVNSDVILSPNVLELAKKVLLEHPNSLLISRRWDYDLNDPIDFNDPSWFLELEEKVERDGELFAHCAIDLFIFPRDLYKKMPPLTIGFPGSKYDNWMIYYAKSKGLKVFDLTAAIKVIHQNHPAKSFSELSEEKASEHMRSLRLVGGYGYCYDTLDADYKVLADYSVQKNPKPKNYYRRKIVRQAQRVVDLVRLKLPWVKMPR
jgi:hypothetical protein